MTVIDETKPLNRLLLEDDHDDLEFHPPRTRRDGAGAWKRKQQNFRFNEAFGPEPVMDRIRESWTRGKLLEEGGDALFETRAGVGRDQVNGQIDMAKVESLLEQAGAIDLTGYKGPTGLFSYDKEDAIKDFQAGNGLRVDGAIKPNGETMRTLRAQLQPRLNAPVKPEPAETPEPDRVQIAESDKNRTAQTTLAQPHAGPKSLLQPDSATLPAPTPQATKTGSSPSPSSKPIMPIPAYKKSVVGLQGLEWQKWGNAVRKLPKLSAAEEKAYMEIFAAEGGTDPDPKSSAVSGIIQGTLDDLIRKGYVKGVAPGTKPGQLPIPKRAEIYRGYINFALKNAGGSAALSRIGDSEAGATLADTVFMHGRGDGARLIQKAINDVIPKKVPIGDAVGNKTFEAYKSLVADPSQRRRLLAALADQRLEFVKNKSNFKGKATRINHFRFQNLP